MSISQVPNEFRYSAELLSEYSIAALDNSKELIDEAILLFENGHLARSYFIAVAAIEEIGKSFLSFDAQGRNLQDSAVTAKIRNSLESHSKKINAAFHASVLSHGDLQNELEGIIDLMIQIKHGREPSMYTDINYINQQVYRPKDVVREAAAKDCIRLAQHCLYKTERHFEVNQPSKRSSNEDAFYGMKDRRVTELFNNEDFWWFHISNMESGENDISASIVLYQREYQAKGKSFKVPESSEQ
jgi:AbiV family abortive infection protein